MLNRSYPIRPCSAASCGRGWRRGLLMVVAMLAASAVMAAEQHDLKDGAKSAGRALGGAAREIGQGAKQVGKTVGEAAKEGGREFRRALKGNGKESN